MTGSPYDALSSEEKARLGRHPVVRAMNAIVDVLMIPYHIKRFFTRYVTDPRVLLRMAPMKEGEPILTIARDDARVAPTVRSWLERVEPALARAGFGPTQWTVNGAPPDSITSVGALGEHAAHGDLVTAIAMQREAKFVGVVSFRSDFADGTRLLTTSASTPRLWPDRRGTHTVRFPDMQDPVELYALHRYRVARKARRSAQVPQSRGATDDARVASEQAEVAAWHQHLVDIGYRERTAEGLRTTVRGARRSAWRRIFPWRQITGWREARAAACVRRGLARAGG